MNWEIRTTYIHSPFKSENSNIIAQNLKKKSLYCLFLLKLLRACILFSYWTSSMCIDILKYFYSWFPYLCIHSLYYQYVLYWLNGLSCFWKWAFYNFYVIKKKISSQISRNSSMPSNAMLLRFLISYKFVYPCVCVYMYIYIYTHIHIYLLLKFFLQILFLSYYISLNGLISLFIFECQLSRAS